MNPTQPEHAAAVPPSIAQELERKTVEEIERLVISLQYGKISDAQFVQAVETLWQTVAGLVEQQTMDILATLKTHVSKNTQERVTRIFCNDSGDTVIAVWNLTIGKVTTLVKKQGDRAGTGRDWRPLQDAIHPSRETKEHYERICKVMLAKPDYVEIHT